MSERSTSSMRAFRMLVFTALALWGAYAGWKLYQARQSGEVIAELLDTSWTENACAPDGTREQLIVAAEQIGQGEFHRVAATLGPIEAPNRQQRLAAQRFLAEAPELRERFIAATTAAERLEAEGADTQLLRDALARSLAAAVRKDEGTLARQLGRAETALDEVGLGGTSVPPGAGPIAVTQWIRDVGPAVNLGRELMTEGNAAAEKLLGRASRHFQAKEYRESAALMELAAALLGVELSTPPLPMAPKWFDALAESPPPQEVLPAQAAAAVELCEAMALSQEPSTGVKTLIRKSRRELDANRADEAYWWAAVALNALGMSDKAIATATETVGAPEEGSDGSIPMENSQ